MFAVALAVFANAALCGWSNWDDPLYVLGNRRVLDPSFSSLLRLWSFADAHLGNFVEYFPLRDSMYWILHRIFGTHSVPYHVLNILFHAVCSVLVVSVGRRLGFTLPASFLSGLLFAVHPAHCESVVWISGLKDPMFTAFLLGAILAYEPDTDGKRRYLLSFALFTLSMLCKSIGFLLPALLLALEWRRGNVTWKSVLAIVPFGLVALLFLANFMLIGRTNNVIIERWGSGPMGSLLTSLWCFVVYLNLQILPIKLYLFHIIPPITSLADVRGVMALIVCVCVGLGMVALLVKNRTGGMLACWFVLFLLPVLNIVPIPVLVAERYLYLPSVAAALGAGAVLTRLAERRRTLAMSLVAIIIVAFAARTVVRNEDWRGGDVALWRGVVTQPTAEVFDSAWMQLGEALISSNQPVEGEAALLRAIAIQEQGNVSPSRRSLTHAYLGITYLEAKRFDLAIHHLQRALSFDARIPDMWNSLSTAEAESGNPARAEHAANMAVQLDASFGKARYNRGLARLDLGRVDEGVADLERAVVDDPGVCHKVSLWLKAVGATPVASRVRAAVAPRCP